MLGSGRRRALRRRMKGGFLPALIPIIAAAIGEIFLGRTKLGCETGVDRVALHPSPCTV